MEYTFRRNLYGEAEAKLSVEQHAFGLWLSEDMQQLNRVNKLIEKLDALLRNDTTSFIFRSEGFFIDVDRSSIELHSNNNHDELENMDDFSGKVEDYDEFQLSDDNHHAHCGPEDFLALLQSWSSYI